MPDFRITAAAGLTLKSWQDQATSTKASRLNDVPGRPRKYWEDTAPLSGTSSVTLRALNAAGALVADAGLGGVLYNWAWKERGLGAPPSLIPVAGTSAELTFVFAPDNVGLWLVCCWRQTHGAVLFPIYVTPTVLL